MNNIILQSNQVDVSGACGSLVHYAFIIAFVGSAFLIFLYLWKKDKLDLDEEPKVTMMKEKDADDLNNHPDSENRGPHERE